MVLVSGVPMTTNVLLCMEANTKVVESSTVGLREMHDCVVVLEEVDLVDGLEGLHAQLLHDLFDLFIVVDLPYTSKYSALLDNLHLSALRTLPSGSCVSHLVLQSLDVPGDFFWGYGHMVRNIY